MSDSNSDPHFRTDKDSLKVNKWSFFRDQCIPGRILTLLQEGEITLTDFLLLCIINDTVQKKEGRTKVGCFCSNSYLANSTNTHPIYVSTRLSELRQRGFILIINLKGQRYLETVWSRIAEEFDETLPTDYGRVYKQEWKAYLKRMRGKKDPLKENLNPPLKENLNPPLKENLNHNYKDKSIKESKIETHCRDKPDGVTSFGNPSNGKLRSSPGRLLAETLREGLSKANKIMRTPVLKAWARQFDETIKDISGRFDGSMAAAEKHVRELLDDHVAHLRDTYQPKLYSAVSFCSNLARLEDARERRLEKETGRRKVVKKVPRRVDTITGNGKVTSRTVYEEVIEYEPC